MSNIENNFNPDCAEDERLMRPTPEDGMHSLTIGEAMQRSVDRIDGVFKDSWKAVNKCQFKNSLGVRLMTFQRLTVDTLKCMKPALLDIVTSQIRTSIVPLLSDEERAELDRVTLDDVLHEIVKQTLG